MKQLLVTCVGKTTSHIFAPQHKSIAQISNMHARAKLRYADSDNNLANCFTSMGRFQTTHDLVVLQSPDQRVWKMDHTYPAAEKAIQ